MENIIKIETSLGIIEIPKDVINKNIPGRYENDAWFQILMQLYFFTGIYTDDEKVGWLFIGLSDAEYGAPEYKIIT